jgi:hypothetical protein
MTPEEYEAKLVVVREAYAPRIEAATLAVIVAQENLRSVTVERDRVESDLRLYADAFERKAQAEAIIAKGEPVASAADGQ